MSISTEGITIDGRVAVYIDFDNVIISRRDQANRHPGIDGSVDVDAILDFASSYGTLTTSRAYADWSRPESNAYRERLLSRAVDTIQMFTTSGKIKNAADIRLSIDVIEDLFLLDSLTHVVIIAGDSDYIPLAQRVKRMGRRVIGIGVAGSTSHLLAAACDEFYDYDELPGLHASGESDEADAEEEQEAEELAAAGTAPSDAERSTHGRGRATRSAGPANGSGASSPSEGGEDSEAADEAEIPRRTSGRGRAARTRATQLLLRALTYFTSKTEEEWHDASRVKSQMLRMEPGFQESALGFSSFTEFLKSRGGVVEIDEVGDRRMLRLREAGRR
jgi:uncharacterized LabA/DUF88 family protein